MSPLMQSSSNENARSCSTRCWPTDGGGVLVVQPPPLVSCPSAACCAERAAHRRARWVSGRSV
jgi:hypothetical protein